MKTEYIQLTTGFDVDEVVQKIEVIIIKGLPKGELSQLLASRVPNWYKPCGLVDQQTLVQLIFKTIEVGHWGQVQDPVLPISISNATSTYIAENIRNVCTAEYIFIFCRVIAVFFDIL